MRNPRQFSSIFGCVAIIICTVALTGCTPVTTTTVVGPGMSRQPTVSVNPPAKASRSQPPGNPDSPAIITTPTTSKTPDNLLEFTDLCAAQMHDICGAMLFYYHANHRLPEKLDDLSRVLAGSALKFACPVSKQQYLYVPQGLTTPGDERRLVLYDATPNPNGKRWAILLRIPTGAQQDADTWVVQLPEGVLRSYLNPLVTPGP